LPSTGRLDGKVVDPPAMTVMARHHGGHDLTVDKPSEYGRGRAAGRPLDVGPWVVPGPGQTGRVPQRDRVLIFTGSKRSDVHLLSLPLRGWTRQ
jgi:hypothetical protein